LKDLAKAVRGLAVMSSDLEAMFSNILNNQVLIITNAPLHGCISNITDLPLMFCHIRLLAGCNDSKYMIMGVHVVSELDDEEASCPEYKEAHKLTRAHLSG
jgi:hypothetical protein